jgi:hypothetical protein
MEIVKNFDLDALEIERFDIAESKERIEGVSTPAGSSCFRTCSCFALCQPVLLIQE